MPNPQLWAQWGPLIPSWLRNMVQPGLLTPWRYPQRRFMQAWEQGTLRPQAHPGQGWRAGHRAWETGIGLELTVHSVTVKGSISRGPVGRRREVTGPCDTRNQPLATSVSELSWPLVSAQAPDPGLYGDIAHPTKTEKPPFSPGSTCRKQTLWVLLVLSSLQRVSFLTRLSRIRGGGLHDTDAATEA